MLGWWVVKYDHETHLSDGIRRGHSDEFGLPVLTECGFDPPDTTRQDYFFTSPAWEALRRWVSWHPRLAKSLATCDTYLRGWYERAIFEAQALSP